MPPLPDGFPDDLRFAEIDDHPHICQAINNASSVIIEDAARVVLSEAEHTVVDVRNLRALLFLPLIAEGFIEKPYHKSELLSVINDVLASSENLPSAK